MWWVEQYKGNNTNEILDKKLDHQVDSRSEFHLKAMIDDPVLYGEHLQNTMASQEEAIAKLLESTTESSKRAKMLFPGMSEGWELEPNSGKLPGMNENWNEQVIAKNDRFDKPFIRSTASINVEDVKDIDTPHDVDNSNQIEKLDLT